MASPLRLNRSVSSKRSSGSLSTSVSSETGVPMPWRHTSHGRNASSWTV